MDASQIFAIERPHKNLMKLYVIRCFLVPPFSFLAFPLLYFRYHTMRYRFDEEGISMRWGILFRREVNLNYARIQDIHLTSGILQRWLGLADIHIQTASGSATAEMTIEGLQEFEDLRDFLYSKMRGSRPGTPSRTGAPAAVAPEGGDDAGTAGLLREIHGEIRAARLALERLADTGAGGGDV